MKNVLCYGDSNTHGYDGVTGGRFPWGVRWTSLVQEALKEEQVRIIEEGQNGRTTVWDDPIEGMKSGLKYLIPCLESHSPLDVVVLMLGTNDIKQRFSLSASDVAAGAEKCYITAELLNRIEGNTAHMAQLLGVEIDTRTWTSLGLLTRAQMQRILDNLATVRAAYYTLPGTPNIPTAPSTLYSAINDMEQVLWSLHELWQRNSVKQYAGEICAGQEIGVI